MTTELNVIQFNTLPVLAQMEVLLELRQKEISVFKKHTSMFQVIWSFVRKNLDKTLTSVTYLKRTLKYLLITTLESISCLYFSSVMK